MAARSHESWRVIRDGVNTLTWNMAQDEAHLEAVANRAVAPTLRLYQCGVPAISLGRFQSIGRTVDLEACSRMGVSVVRRITGGRGIVHGDDLIVSVAARRDSLGCAEKGSRAILQVYERLSACYIEMFSRLMIDVRRGEPRRVGARDRRGNCFDLITSVDIVECATGEKLLGAALCCHGDAILQQASIPLRSDVGAAHADQIAAAVFGSTNGVLLRARPEADAIAAALLESWSDHFDCQSAHETPVSHGPSGAENRAAVRLLSDRYQQECWTLHGEHSPQA